MRNIKYRLNNLYCSKYVCGGNARYSACAREPNLRDMPGNRTFAIIGSSHHQDPGNYERSCNYQDDETICEPMQRTSSDIGNHIGAITKRLSIHVLIPVQRDIFTLSMPTFTEGAVPRPTRHRLSRSPPPSSPPKTRRPRTSGNRRGEQRGAQHREDPRATKINWEHTRSITDRRKTLRLKILANRGTGQPYTYFCKINVDIHTQNYVSDDTTLKIVDSKHKLILPPS